MVRKASPQRKNCGLFLGYAFDYHFKVLDVVPENDHLALHPVGETH